MTNFSQRICATVSLENIEKNFRAIRELVGPGCRVLCVVKADAYGHGAVPVARRLSTAGAEAFAVATVLIVALMLTHTLQRRVHITLPAPSSASSDVQTDPEGNRSALSIVEITPKSVQAAIETLSRPASYRRTVTLEQFWEGGSGSWTVSAYVKGKWQRTDRLMPDHRMRHTITDGETVYIWYNSEKTVFTAPAGDITADHDQTIPTYEEILNLDASRIAAADYRDLEGLRCIYVETAESENGYALRYWVSVDSGLLVSSEKLYHGEVIYRMSALTLEPTAPVNSDFALPDGTQLISQ